MKLRPALTPIIAIAAIALIAGDASAYYASHMGRWVTRDPIGYRGGTLNLYEYVAPTPVRTGSVPSLGDLAAMPSKQLDKQDLALVNLRCAEGLPGAEKLNVEQTLVTLDRWASSVRHETDRHL